MSPPTPDERAADYPAHVHRFSPMLTLQGAVAHCDMPVATGPTMYLPTKLEPNPSTGETTLLFF